MKLLRSIVFVIWLYGAMAVIGLALWIPVLLNDRHVWTALRAWTRATLWGLRWIVGARVRLEGLEHAPTGAALIAMKHQSMLDTLVPSLLLEKPVFVFKKELGDMPIMGAYLKRNQIAVDRGGHAKALKSLMRGRVRPSPRGGRW
jgi:1-acyl-sn-glycerol-3-phosphate acyltransferase